ncbi:2-polyprenyl-6-methoxyphenol hydroxylase-like FAD-dependent oxidoreductase [Pseudoduganella flava]|uniref:2,4-dichlorophenol 6-monooxygenase n=1 Tax=Pseudoduganella flava TaxID=871742 RepID=A0A562Q207_9BURK|nr:FAD-dependent monooxygenase [Pseudoduganella flava]QGZ38119.1 2,4-dichlorophenol 6-monooxygenase [Pseudoduganella flava]TWI50366.1 2-polyprenyl-6-methoxyphenol hydroxylase-like FAD-dependent oxidoreductase [Pseudoduganella flava]
MSNTSTTTSTITSTTERIPVLIIGGSLVGLSAALFLAWRGIRPVVIEKHTASSPHPRAIGFTERTLEFYRAVGIADRIPQVPPGTRLRRVRATSLTGDWHGESDWTPGQDGAHAVASPCTGAALAQDRLEPILRTAAAAHGAELRLGVEMLAFEQLDDGVPVDVRDRATQQIHRVMADYVIAADGADSAIRETLGIARRGVGHLRTLRSLLFRCPEADPVLAKGIQQFNIEQPDLRAFLTTYGDGRWVLMFDDTEAYRAADPHELVHKALGSPFAVEMLAAGRWEMAGRIAERYRAGRIFLAGDAAHQLPPTRGGFGANTGIDDTWNLAWKLAWVLQGHSSSRLLDTYDAERQPIGWLRHQQTFARPDYARWAGDALQGETLYANEAMELGQLHRSFSVIGAGAELPPAASPAEWAGQPGTRAPHVWIQRDGQRLSTLDLFAHELVLLTGDGRWTDAARTAAARLPLPFKAVRVGSDVTFPADVPFDECFGVSSGGAVLIRPDGIIAWRSVDFPVNAAAVLEDALRTVGACPA